MEMKLTPRFYQNGERVFGPGVAELLKRVQEHRSLRAAAFSMEMAYSKAWQIIRTAEDGFGCKLLSSTIGGRHGGGAVLTPEGERILNAYERFAADINAYSQERFQENFRDLVEQP
ncbi:winged helix-turn-helix domain-containing protein [uncultured Dysosmobacter sp.]|uniref:winged helix-turn-helix domain-containing protein n=1 Tax=uncultured Dysosmobacter sp. TaxID=2591384 RepID=UPI0026727AD6|nr:LysR family transcriptional regulator [uncultured Dysosmobacter sp.]